MSESVMLVETTTGRIVDEIQVLDSPTWSRGVNMRGSLTVKIPLPGYGNANGPLGWIGDGSRWSLAYDVNGRIAQAGPISAGPKLGAESGGVPYMEVPCSGLWWLFDNRVARNNSYTGAITSELADLTYSGLSLHTIAKRILQAGEVGTGYDLPIVYPADISGIHERTYEAYRLAMLGSRLYELTQVIDGPDVELSPRYSSTPGYIEWEARIGNPQLTQGGDPHVWDSGAALTSISVEIDTSRLVSQAWVRGNGVDRNMLYSRVSDNTLVNLGWPAMDLVDESHSSAEVQETLDGWAQSNLDLYKRPVELWGAEVLASPRDVDPMSSAPAFGDFLPGDQATFAVLDHPWIPDGQYGTRILGIDSIADDIGKVKLTLHNQGV